MEQVAYYNGEIGAPEDLRVPFLDRVAFYGDGVYDATSSKDGVMLYMEDHLDRFFNSMRFMRFEPNFTREWLEAELQRVVDMADARENFVYWQITRGTAPRKHSFPEGVQPNLWIMVTPLAAMSDEPVGLYTYDDKRFGYCNVKTLNLLPNVMAAQHAEERGGQEALFVRDGYVTECAHSNVHILKDGVLVTHPADNHILPGIARKHLLAACERLGVPVEERLFTPDELKAADEVMITSSTRVLTRVGQLDGEPVGCRDGEAYERLNASARWEYDEYVEKRISAR